MKTPHTVSLAFLLCACGPLATGSRAAEPPAGPEAPAPGQNGPAGEAGGAQSKPSSSFGGFFPGVPSDGGVGLAEVFLKRELTSRIGPARSYEVRVDRQGTDLSRFQLGAVDVVGDEVRTPVGLVITRLELHLDPFRLGPDFRPTGDMPASSFTARFSAADLTRFARRRAPAGIQDLDVGFERGMIVLHGRPEVAGVRIDSEVAGQPVLRRRREIHFHASRVAVFGIRITDLTADVLEKAVNPIVDLSDLKLPVQFQRLRVARRFLVLGGTMDFGAVINRTQKPQPAPETRGSAGEMPPAGPGESVPH